MSLSRPRIAVLVLALLSVGLIVGACSSDDGDEAAAAGGGEVFLEPAATAGPDPFMPGKAGRAPAPPPRKADGAAGQETEAGTPVASEVGTTPELYGGSGEVGVCDKAGIVRFLTENPEQRVAWATVLGISPADDEVEVARYVEGLAPVVLRADTRVTNHGYVDGRATPRQSILEAGTAVLVDARGVPRVRCACGNPLLEPVPVSTGPVYQGEPWDGFAPERVVVVRPGPPVQVIVVVNITGPGVVEVPVGTTTPEPAPTATAPPAEPEQPATVPEGEATDDTYLSCARRYGELVRELVIAGVPPRPNWPADAQRAAELAREGDIAGAIEICEMTVAEMEEALAGA